MVAFAFPRYNQQPIYAEFCSRVLRLHIFLSRPTPPLRVLVLQATPAAPVPCRPPPALRPPASTTPTAQTRLAPVQATNATAMELDIQEPTARWSSTIALGLPADLVSAFPNQEASSASVDLTTLGPPALIRESWAAGLMDQGTCRYDFSILEPEESLSISNTNLCAGAANVRERRPMSKPSHQPLPSRWCLCLHR